MFFDLYLAAMIHLLGAIIFKRFEERTPMHKSLRKVVFIHGIAAVLVFTVGRPWSLIWIFGMFGLGLVFHFWWANKHHIHPVTAEPRAEYYALRGWEMS
jgi:hypothetical protein